MQQRLSPTLSLLLTLSLVAVAFSGCTGDQVDRFEAYREQTALAVGAPVAQSSDSRPGFAMPFQVTTTAHDIDTERIGISAYLSLPPCPQLNDLIAQRNSGLGRVMASSQRLVYEQEFLVQAEQCALDETLTAADLSALETLITTKRAARDRLLWNATLGGAEFSDHVSSRKLLNGAQIFRLREALSGPTEALEKLASLVQKTRDGVSLDSSELEEALQKLDRSRAGGHALATIEHATEQMAAARASLSGSVAEVEKQGPASTLCTSLNSVFSRHYAPYDDLPGVRDFAVELYQASEPWARSVAALFDELSTLAPEELAPEFASTVALASAEQPPNLQAIELLADELADQARTWQPIIDQCGWTLAPELEQTVPEREDS